MCFSQKIVLVEVLHPQQIADANFQMTLMMKVMNHSKYASGSDGLVTLSKTMAWGPSVKQTLKALIRWAHMCSLQKKLNILFLRWNNSNWI